MAGTSPRKGLGRGQTSLRRQAGRAQLLSLRARALSRSVPGPILQRNKPGAWPQPHGSDLPTPTASRSARRGAQGRRLSWLLHGAPACPPLPWAPHCLGPVHTCGERDAVTLRPQGSSSPARTRGPSPSGGDPGWYLGSGGQLSSGNSGCRYCSMDFKTTSNLSRARSSPIGCMPSDSSSTQTTAEVRRCQRGPLEPPGGEKEGARPCRRPPGKAPLRARALLCWHSRGVCTRLGSRTQSRVGAGSGWGA